MRKICVVVGSRANYSSIKTAMRAIQEHPDLQLQVVASASALLDRYGRVVELMKKDGFPPDASVYMLVEGETPSTMAKSTGLGVVELASAFEKLEPDIVVTVGDRFETMATALAAAYMNLGLAHTMGGEVSGTIDESIRHAVTKFSHIHFPACSDARERIIKLGEDPEKVYDVGCPRIDLVKQELAQPLTAEDESFLNHEGVGSALDLSKPFIIVSQHPVTTEYGEGDRQISSTLRAVASTDLQAVVLWPNADAGSEDIARGVRKFREASGSTKFRYFKNLPTSLYVRLMAGTSCLVGNSSSGIREGAYIGTPVVNIGTRQHRRQRGKNVIDVPEHDQEGVASAIHSQLGHGKYPSEPIYGNGNAGTQIADILSTCTWNVQKLIAY